MSKCSVSLSWTPGVDSCICNKALTLRFNQPRRYLALSSTIDFLKAGRTAFLLTHSKGPTKATTVKISSSRFYHITPPTLGAKPKHSKRLETWWTRAPYGIQIQLVVAHRNTCRRSSWRRRAARSWSTSRVIRVQSQRTRRSCGRALSHCCVRRLQRLQLLRGLFIGQFNAISACSDPPNHSSYRENHKRNILISLKDDKSLTVSSIELVDYGWPGTFFVYENVDATDVKSQAVSVPCI